MSWKGNFDSRLAALELGSGAGHSPCLMTFDFKLRSPFHWYFENYQSPKAHSGLVRLTDDELTAKFPDGVPDRVQRVIYEWAVAK